MGILKMTEWQDSAGRFHCADVSNISGGSSLWWHPARMLNITPAEFVELLIKKYKVTHISYYEPTKFVYFWWDSQADMRVYKNDMNKAARERRYQI